MKLLPRLVVIAAVGALAPGAFAYEPVSLAGFADSIHHWRNLHRLREYPRYAPEQIVEIAENVLLYQRSNGGWPANEEPTRILDEAERREQRARRARRDTTFDNRSTYTHIDYLAGVYSQVPDARYRSAVLEGIAYVLAAQYPNGGFPHSFPSEEEEYHPRITFADDIMPGVFAMLRRVASAPQYAFVPAEIRRAAAEAVRRGDACVLGLQIRDAEGRRTAWAGQYDPETLQPARGRTYELPAVVARESVPVVRYLMSIEPATPEIVAAVEGAVEWFQRARLSGWRLETFEAEPVHYRYHTSTTDRRLVADPSAPPLWARFYELDRPEPFLANRDGRKVYSLAEVERERRTGYDWYGTWPAELLEREYPAWRAKVGQR